MIELRPDRRIAILAMYDSNGFQAIIDVLENICIESENDLIGETPVDAQRVLALHAIAHAHRAMLTKAINQIDTLVGESREGKMKNTMQQRTAGLAEE